MKNLARDKDCDSYIMDELERAGIEATHGGKSYGEVPASITGRLGPFTFTRAWYYWVVSGPMPLDVAKELYAHPEGKRTVRVAGHAGCPAPEEPWVKWYDDNGSCLWPRYKYEKELAQFKDTPHLAGKIEYMVDSGEFRVSDDMTKDGVPYVMSYHIDDQAGLLLFAMKVKDHALHVNPSLILLAQKIKAKQKD